MKLNILFILIVLVLIGAQAKKAKKWRPPLEYGPKTTGIYSSLQRSNRRKINVNLLDPYDDRTKPPRAKLSGTSYKPGTWNWYPNMDIPGYSYRFKIFNLTKDQAGSYMGMHDYRKDYGPLYNTRFGGTYPPIPPLLGDARQPRLAWFLKKYSAPAPPANYIDHVMETIKDGHLRDREFEKQLDAKNTKKVSAEWYTVRPKNESNYFYEEEKIKPRFGDYGGIGLEEAFPAYKPKKPYEVVMLPVQPVYKRAPQWMVDKARNIYNPRLPSKEMYDRIEARDRKQKTRRNRRYNRYGRTFSDKHMSYYDNLYFSSTQGTQKPTQPQNTRRTYIPNLTVASIPKDELYYEKLFETVTRIVGATRRTFIPNVKIAYMNMKEYTTPKNYLDNYEIPITKPFGSRHSDETMFATYIPSKMNKDYFWHKKENPKKLEPDITKKPHQSQEIRKPFMNHARATMVPFNANPNAKWFKDQLNSRNWPSRRPRRGRRTYMTRGPNSTYPTLRNFESPVEFPDGHIEPPYDISMTNKTYPPMYYDKINASFYDDYYGAPRESWMESEYRRWHGQRVEGMSLESVDDDYYSEYANWYLKKRDNSTEDRMFEVYDSNSPRPTRPTGKNRIQRRKKKLRDVSEVSGFSEYERGMKKRFDKMMKKMMNHLPNTIHEQMKNYTNDLLNDPKNNELMKSEPFKDLLPQESNFKTDTVEAFDTSSMERYFLHDAPAYPEKEKAYKRRMAMYMRRRKKHKTEMEEFKKQMGKMKSKIDQLSKKKNQSRGLFRNLYGKNSLLRKLKVNFFSNPRNRNLTRNIKDKVKSIFSFVF